MDIGTIKRDSAAISAGQWVKDIPEMGDIEIKVRGLSSPSVIAARAVKERRASKEKRNRDGSLKAEITIEIMREILAENILIDIKGLTQSGKRVSAEKAKTFLLDPDYEPLADAVFWAAQAVDRGVAEDTEKATKN